MYKATVYTAEGQKGEERDLPESLFDGTVHEPALWQTVKAYLANQRQGTSATKTRTQVKGGNRKPWRQKGTGRARQGSIRAPHWRGGGVVFGPRPERNFTEQVPKKVRWLARRSAYNARAQDGAVLLIEPLSLDAPRTRRIVQLLEAVGAQGNVLLLTDGHKPLVYLSSRNIPQLVVRPFGQESAYEVLWADTVVIETPALERAAEVAHA
jgi:large subunit ribosomal protein L4